ncbi:MAG TPA: hypothetical protein DEP53_16110 [Bacteroidetes bacterium]|nr:MAG: hypothetical protein A2X66_06725 [Ignavibacteria bacterium GWA2_54_16]HCA81255.1 hypothetical protein [Bacteroidota bacterium]
MAGFDGLCDDGSLDQSVVDAADDEISFTRSTGTDRLLVPTSSEPVVFRYVPVPLAGSPALWESFFLAAGNPPGGGEDELWDSICLCGRRICFCRLRPTYKASDIGLIMGLVGSSSFVIFNRFSTISSEQATRWLGFS